MSATATTEKKYLKWYQKLAYGSGDLASNCSYGLVSSFVLLYLTGTLGLDSAIIGSLMLASKVLDGISDVIFGTLIDRTHSKLGKARPWMLFGQVGVSLCLFLLFAIPAGSTTMQYILLLHRVHGTERSVLYCQRHCLFLSGGTDHQEQQ